MKKFLSAFNDARFRRFLSASGLLLFLPFSQFAAALPWLPAGLTAFPVILRLLKFGLPVAALLFGLSVLSRKYPHVITSLLLLNLLWYGQLLFLILGAWQSLGAPPNDLLAADTLSSLSLFSSDAAALLSSLPAGFIISQIFTVAIFCTAAVLRTRWQEKFRFEMQWLLVLFLLLHLPGFFRHSPAVAGRNDFHLFESRPNAPGRGKNLILFILEGVPRSRLPRDMLPQQLLQMPALESPHLFVPVPHSSSALFALLTGRIPGNLRRPDAASVSAAETLPGIAAANGYDTAIFTSAYSEYEGIGEMLRRYCGRVLTGEALSERVAKTDFPWGTDDALLPQAFSAWQRRRPYLAVVLFSATHSPYFFPGKNSPRSDEERFNAALKHSLEAMGNIVRSAEELSPGGQMYLVSSDHGESFGEFGFQRHGFSVFASETDVPFLLFGIEGSADWGGQADILPTLLEITGMKFSGAFQGSSLLQRRKDRRVVSRTWSSNDAAAVSTPGRRIHCLKNRGQIWVTGAEGGDPVRSDSAEDLEQCRKILPGF